MEKNTKDFKISKKKLKRIIRIALLVLCILLVLKVISLISKDKNPNNLSNMGLAVEYKGKTYFNKWEVGIFWTKGTTEKQVTNETAYSMTLVGDRIYYITVSKDGGTYIKYLSLSDDSVNTVKNIYSNIDKFYVNGNDLYYISNENAGAIVKLNMETNEETIIAYTTIKDFQLVDDEIYFTDSVYSLYKIDINTLEITNIKSEANIKKFQVEGKYIYYYDMNQKGLYRMSLKGDKVIFISDKITENGAYNVTNKHIYFFDPETNYICKMNQKGSSIRKIVKIQSNKTKINVVGKAIYYLNTSDDATQSYQINRVKVSGGSMRKIKY
ncbi:MAG: DUF5050 domain-containing protein [Clostridia bacterium]|nr:DUF5050 domain-containing protein [Clostridia bacterium]